MSGNANREAIEAEFKQVDRDNSGDLSFAEIRRNMEQMYGDVPLTDKQLKSVLDQADTNKDGKIQIDEFQALI